MKKWHNQQQKKNVDLSSLPPCCLRTTYMKSQLTEGYLEKKAVMEVPSAVDGHEWTLEDEYSLVV